MTNRRSLAILIAVTLLAGCAGRSTPATVDPDAAAAALEAARPDRPLRIIFDWRIQEREARFSGRGSARVEPEYKARLDLFGPRGDGYLSAALVGSELRLPPGTPDVRLPPPSLMWAVMGVVRPPDRATLAGTRQRNEETELHYSVDDARLVYVLRGSRLRSVEWEGEGRRMTVELRGDVDGLPRDAVYREWSGYTELVLNLESVDEVDTYPPEIWNPGW